MNDFNEGATSAKEPMYGTSCHGITAADMRELRDSINDERAAKNLTSKIVAIWKDRDEALVRSIRTLEAERDMLKHIVGEIYHFAERCPVCGQSKNVREGDELMHSGRKHNENCKLKAFL